jgi:hypothetical protein
MARPDVLLERYENHPRRFEAWQAHKPVSVETIRRKRLGMGVLPASRCKHERLIVPILDGTMLVGLRGRAIACSCGKWLVAGGTTLEMLPLYNQEALQPGCVVWIVENPVDALLLTERTPYAGVATYSVSYWRQAWTETLQAAQPELMIVAYDNDDPGRKNGIRLANTLLAAGLQVTLFDWGQAVYKADIGSLLMGVNHG